MKKTSSTADLNEHNKSVDLNAYFIFGAIVLVFLLGMYAIFSPGVQSQGNPACGKIVIAADGSTLRSNVAASLQEALYFLVVDPLSGKLVEVVRNPYRGPQPNAQIAYLVAGKGEEAVIVGNIDQQSYNILMQFGIRTFGGYTGQTKKVISLYRQARISAQSPMPETLPQPGMQVQQTQPAVWGGQPAYSGPVYPNAFPSMQGPNSYYPGQGPNCPFPVRQGWGQAAMAVPDGDTIRRTNPVTQVAFGQGGGAWCPLPGQAAALAQQVPANVANNPLWERAAAAVPQQTQQGNITWELAAAQQQAAIAQQQAAAQQAAVMAAQQPPANVANNPLWERAAAAVPQQTQQGNITWELAAAQQQAAMAQQQVAMAQQAAAQQQAAMAQQAAVQQQAAMAQQAAAQAAAAQQQAAMAQQAAAMAAQQPPANVANNPLWERAAANMAGPGTYYNPNGAMAPVAAQVPVSNAPPIMSNAQMPHAYRGNCADCHQIISAQANNQNAQAAANQMMWNNMPQGQNSLRVGVGNGVVR